MRHTRAHTGNRRSHHKLAKGGYSKCPDCGQPVMQHTVCMNCGKYKGRQVLNVHAALEKKEKKAKAKKE
jgi:large subunit ribosomal protein L32